MISVAFNGIDMSGKSTLMKKVKEVLEEKDFVVRISPHLMKFTDMSFMERLAMYEEWTPDDFTKQTFIEVCKRAEYMQRKLSDYDYVLNDRGVLTQVGFCAGKYMTENGLSLIESYRTVEEASRKIPFEDISITLDLPLDIALQRAEGKEDWGEHYQRLIQNTRKAIQYVSSQGYRTDVCYMRGFKNLDELCESTVRKILNQ